jgi:hypothetical protein
MPSTWVAFLQGQGGQVCHPAQSLSYKTALYRAVGDRGHVHPPWTSVPVPNKDD